MEVDGRPSKENLSGQSALLMNAAYIVFPLTLITLDHEKKITSFSTNPFISGWLSKATAFMVTPKMMINALTFCF